MGFRSTLIKPFAKKIARDINRWSSHPIKAQEEIMKTLVASASKTKFGIDHDFSNIKNYQDFKARIPVKDYEGIRSYVELIKEGQKDVLWPGKPMYFAKTSGTTSGVKYIPLTKSSLPNHFGTARNALFNYYARTGHGDWLDGKMIFLSGSPALEKVGGINTGRLSGIVNHQVPSWLRTNQLPSYETNCIEDWEDKLNHIVEETFDQDMRMISGIPPWVQMYYERLLEKTGKPSIKALFPNFNIFVFGGVNFEPYRESLEELLGGQIPILETYPASEGFIAFQDQQGNKGLLLNVASGIFFEFIPVDEYFNENPTRLSLAEVELDTNYALILNTNAGLWGYSIGDTVKFVSKAPYRLLVTGRIKHFISAFGEHVIGKEVEEAMLSAIAKSDARIVEFTVAPQVNPSDGQTPYHEWLIEFEKTPTDIAQFSADLEHSLIMQNIYYEDLIKGGVLQALKITILAKDAFRDYMKSQGKLGGQNKVPRLTNDRKIADTLRRK